MRSGDIIRQLEAAGWRQVRQTGGHKQFRHPDRPGTVTVPHRKRDMAIGAIRSIERQSGLALR